MSKLVSNCSQSTKKSKKRTQNGHALKYAFVTVKCGPKTQLRTKIDFPSQEFQTHTHTHTHTHTQCLRAPLLEGEYEDSGGAKEEKKKHIQMRCTPLRPHVCSGTGKCLIDMFERMIKLGARIERELFLLKLFPPGHPTKNPGISLQKVWSSWVSRDIPNPFTWKTPTPAEDIRTKKFEFGFLFLA